MKMRSTLGALVAVIALTGSTGCGLSGGMLRDSQTVNRFDYQIRLQGLRFVRTAQGFATVGSALCIIPLGDSLYANAMRELHANARLQENEVLVNMREDRTTVSYLGFYCQTKVVLSGDVMHLQPEGAHGGPVPFPPPPPPPAVP